MSKTILQLIRLKFFKQVKKYLQVEFLPSIGRDPDERSEIGILVKFPH
jgi:hypothetical protein